MDLSIIIGDWPYDEDEEASNVRKVVGVDGLMKVQVRLHSGLIQWEVEGRPDGEAVHGFPTALDYCTDLLLRQSHATGPSGELPAKLDAEFVNELTQELFDYYKRGRALFLLGDYRRALADALHNLKILRLIRENCLDEPLSFNYDRYRPTFLVERARYGMLLNLQAGDIRKALDALNKGIEDIEDFHVDYELDERLGDSSERRILVDLRRSLRERYNVPLDDRELLQSLKVEQAVAIRRENYEMAARLRDKIDSLRQRMANRK